MIQELEQQLKDRPVLWAFLQPLLEYLKLPNLVEVNVNKPGELPSPARKAPSFSYGDIRALKPIVL
mgnify:CR=1 FL=1